MRLGWKVSFLLVVLAGLLTGGAMAQQTEVIVGEIGFPEKEWGKQNLSFEVTNTTDWLKFLVVETETGFEDSFTNPHRVTRSNFIFEPGKSTIDPEINIPSNYGRLTLWIRIYAVVDTLDDLSLGTVILEQPFKIRFRTPEAVVPYLQERLSLPPLVGRYGILDSEFTRLMLLFSNEGKSPVEIADICQIDSAYVIKIANEMVKAELLARDSDRYIPAIPVISGAFAAEGRELADEVAGRLSEVIATNLADRLDLIDSLVRVGLYSGDSNNFFEGGTLLYDTYPLVTGMYMWQLLGQKFISGRSTLLIFAGTDPCHTKIGKYMYMVQGGDYFVGNHYYNAQRSPGGFLSRFGDRIPVVECRPGFEKKYRLRESVDWVYSADYQSEHFLYDTTLINPMLRLLDRGVEEVMIDAITRLRVLNKKHGFKQLDVGTRYWFWNLTATRVVAGLVESGSLTPMGNGQFSFTEKKL